MISCAKKFDINVGLSTNFQVPFSERGAEEMIYFKLDTLVLFIDGASRETYEKYQRGGDFSKTIKNIKTLVMKKKELKSNLPNINWKFIVFRHDEHEVKIAQKMGKELEVDRVQIESTFIPVDLEEYKNWVPLNSKYSKYDLNKKPSAKAHSEDFFQSPPEETCDWPWLGITINWDGSVAPCCGIYREEDDFGNFFNQKNFSQLWNNSFYITARNFLKNKGRFN